MLSNTILGKPEFAKIAPQNKSFLRTYLDTNNTDDIQTAGIPDQACSPFIFNKKMFTFDLNMNVIEGKLRAVQSLDPDIEVTINSVCIVLLPIVQYPVGITVKYTIPDSINAEIVFVVDDPYFTDDFFANNNVLRYRPIGRAITIYNTTPAMYKRGVITACQIQHDVKSTNSGNAIDIPHDTTSISSMRRFKQVPAEDGLYGVSFNSHPVFYYVRPYGTSVANSEFDVTLVTKIYQVTEDTAIANNGRFVDWYSNQVLSLWSIKTSLAYNTVVASVPVDLEYGVFTIKCTQAFELIVGYNSPIVPYSEAPIDVNLDAINFVQRFVADYNGLYPSYYNSNGKLFENIKHFFSTGKWVTPAAGIAKVLLNQVLPGSGIAVDVIAKKVNEAYKQHNAVVDKRKKALNLTKNRRQNPKLLISNGQ